MSLLTSHTNYVLLVIVGFQSINILSHFAANFYKSFHFREGVVTGGASLESSFL